MFNRIQLHLISKCSFTRQDTLLCKFASTIKIMAASSSRSRTIAGMVSSPASCADARRPPVTRNDFITTVGARTDNRRSENSEISFALCRFHHFFIINHTEGDVPQREQLRKGISCTCSCWACLDSSVEKISSAPFSDVCAFFWHCQHLLRSEFYRLRQLCLWDHA